MVAEPVEGVAAAKPRPDLRGRMVFSVTAETLIELMAAAEGRANELMAGIPFEVEGMDVREADSALCIGGVAATVVLRYDVVREGGWSP